MSHEQHKLPLTLTIIRPPNNIQSNNIVYPQFNHSPIEPILISAPPPAYTVNRINKPANQSDMNQQEKIERNRQLNREYQKKFREKTKGFLELSHLPNINERIKQLWLLTYPDADKNMDSKTMDLLIAQFVNSMLTSVKY
jgi:hypothetical protein